MTATPQSTHGVVTDCMTLTRYLLEEQRKYPEATGDLTQLMSHVLTAVKAVASAVRRAGLSSLYSNIATFFFDILYGQYPVKIKLILHRSGTAWKARATCRVRIRRSWTWWRTTSSSTCCAPRTRWP